jgi:hypothetical protein
MARKSPVGGQPLIHQGDLKKTGANCFGIGRKQKSDGQE